MKTKRVKCIKNNGYGDVIVGKTYEMIPDEKAEQNHCVRIIDESGEDYLYSIYDFAESNEL
jgi:hypothetical protein